MALLEMASRATPLRLAAQATTVVAAVAIGAAVSGAVTSCRRTA